MNGCADMIEKIISSDETIQEESNTFAKGECFYKYLTIFIIGSLLGVIYEDILHLMKTGEFMTHRGEMFLPLNPLYGFGIMLLMVGLSKIKEWYHCIVYGSIVGGGIEYFASWGLELISGQIAWDYSHLPTNIDGRTTVYIALFWGVCGFLLAKFVYPYLACFIESWPKKIATIIIKTIWIVMIIDMVVSYLVLSRQMLRSKGYESFTFIGETIDRVFTDERIEVFFPNMRTQVKE